MTTTTQEPKKKFVTVSRQEGRYTLGSAEESARYYFVIEREDAQDLWKSFLVDLEKDDINVKEQTPLEIANEIKEVYDCYWVHTGMDNIRDMIQYLESIEKEEAAAREAYELEYAKYQVAYWTERVNELS